LDNMDFTFVREVLPFWDELGIAEQSLLRDRMIRLDFEAGMSVHSGGDCSGLVIVKRGQLRTYILSEGGREITLFRLFERDVCVLTSSCIMKNITFDIHAEAEKESEVYLIPTEVFRQLDEANMAVKSFTAEIIASRLSDVMWVIEQVVFMSLDRRLASFLLDLSSIEGSMDLPITHDAIARNIGSAREAVTRMLRYFQSEGMVALSRGRVRLTDHKKLQRLASG